MVKMIVKKDKIIIDKVETELDKLLINFLEVLKKYCDYVVVSGYVAILFGRARGTEDIDILIKSIDKNKFEKFFEEIENKGYYCLNTPDIDEMYDFIKIHTSLRFARKDEIIPNIEVKIGKDLEDFNEKVLIEMPFGSIWISCIEKQIIFKEMVLGSDKDFEDARHLRKLFEGKLDLVKLRKFENRYKNEYKRK